MFFYALISRGTTVLVENTGQANMTGNFEVIARVILSKLDEPNQPPRRSVGFEEYSFHILSDDGLSFVVLTDKAVPTSRAFEFLSEVKQRFATNFKRQDWEHAIAHSFNADFSGMLSVLMAKYNTSTASAADFAGDAQVARVQEQLDEVKGVIRTNIDSLLNRGERIELLVDTTERLTQASFKFQESATRLKNQHWWQSKKNQITLAVVILIVVFLIIVTSCGGLDLGNC